MLKTIEMGKCIARSLYLAIEVLIRQCTNLSGQTVDLFFVAEPRATQQLITTHKSNATCALSLQPIRDYYAHCRRSHDAMNELSTRPKAQMLQSSRNDNLFCSCCNQQIPQPRIDYCAQCTVALQSLSVLRMPCEL